MDRVAVIMGKYTPGGIKSVIMNYYRGMDKQKYQFDIFIYADSPDSDFTEIESLGGRVYKVSNIKKPLKFIFDLKTKLRKNKYKIVHGYLNTLNVFAMLAAKLAGCPIRIAENLSTAHPGEKKTVIKDILKPFSRYFATNIAANSLYAAQWLYGDKASDAYIIRNALDLDKYKYNSIEREKVRAQYALEDKFVIGHVGRFSYQKNHNFLIDIFSEVIKKDSHAVLLLIGYGELEQKIKEKVSKLQLSSNVIFAGKTEDLSKYYNAMDCFVLPSFYEGLPVVGIEAQAFGLPCILSKEITQETKILDTCSFLSLEDPASTWADSILKTKKMCRPDNNEMVKNAGYCLKEETQKLITYYDSLIADLS